jgi:hypothetical protein
MTEVTIVKKITKWLSTVAIKKWMNTITKKMADKMSEVIVAKSQNG